MSKEEALTPEQRLSEVMTEPLMRMAIAGLITAWVASKLPVNQIASDTPFALGLLITAICLWIHRLRLGATALGFMTLAFVMQVSNDLSWTSRGSTKPFEIPIAILAGSTGALALFMYKWQSSSLEDKRRFQVAALLLTGFVATSFGAVFMLASAPGAALAAVGVLALSWAIPTAIYLPKQVPKT